MKRIGVDIGGTFTDIVIFDTETRRIIHDKTLSTPRQPEVAVINYIKEKNWKFDDVEVFVHGTTVATNAVIERKGARIGMITTRGHKDRLDLQRTNLLSLYDFNYQKPEPLIPRNLRKEVKGRTLYDGSILEPLDKEEVIQAAKGLVEQGVEAIVVAFLNSYANPIQEMEAKEIIEKEFPTVHVVTSSETAAEVLEYERFSTAAVNAYLMPVMDRYLKGIEDVLEQRGLRKGRFMVMQGNGGMVSAALASRRAGLSVESGPAGGVVGSQYICTELLGLPNVVTFDMGGTSTDVCLVRAGNAYVTLEYKVAGHPMRLPMYDIYSIGAGGGSIAWIDEGGGLHVGPQSAGSDPGPACYGLGGSEPTITDAHVVLGRLDPEYALGGRVMVRADLARKAITRIASFYNLSVEKAAASIIDIANENMTNAIRVITVEKGVDPSEYVLCAYGGAGGLHAGFLMKRMGMKKAILPPVPGTQSALGLVTSDIKHDFVRSILKQTKEASIDEIHVIFDELRQQAEDVLREEGVKPEDMHIEYKCDMRYLGQAYVPCIVPFAIEAPRSEQLIKTEETFHWVHRELYKHALESALTEIVSLRISAIGRVQKPHLKKEEKKDRQIEKRRRKVYFEDVGEFVDCDVYWRDDLPAGFSCKGPAVISQLDATSLVFHNEVATVDEYGNIIVQLEE